jgi:hypothetical protein
LGLEKLLKLSFNVFANLPNGFATAFADELNATGLMY